MPIRTHIQPALIRLVQRSNSTTQRHHRSMSAYSSSASHAITRQKYYHSALLTSLPVVALSEGEATILIKAETVAAAAPAPSSSSASSDPLSQIDLRTFRVTSTFLCTTCRVAFEASEELRSHSKSAWHLHNLRVKQRKDDHAVSSAAASGVNVSDDAHTILDEASFDRLQATEAQAKAAAAGEEDSASSGGSASENDEDIAEEADSKEKADEYDDTPIVGSSRITFYTPTQKFTLWKHLLMHTSSPSAHLPLHLKSFEYVTALRALPSRDQIAIVMSSGGRFAGAVFKRDTMLVHKCFERYTTRRKQGGSQAAYDKANGQAHSIGSSIRRKETVRFQEETQRILGEWSSQLAGCHYIFIFAPSANRAILMKSLDKNDERVRNVPFPTYKPKLDEVKRIHQQLVNVEFEDRANIPYDLENQVEVKEKSNNKKANASASSAAASSTPAAIPAVDPLASLPEPVTDDSLLNAIRVGDLSAVKQLITSGYQRPFTAGQKRYRPLVYEAVEADGMKLKSVSSAAASSSSSSTVAAEANDDDDESELSSKPTVAAPQTVHQSILAYLLTQSEDANEQVLVQDPSNPRHIVCWSALHRACSDNNLACIIALLEHNDVNPTLRDSRSRLPLPLITSSNVRLSVRRFAGSHIELHDWSACELVPLTADGEKAAEEARKVKAKEKRAKAKVRAKEKKVEEEQAEMERKKKEEDEIRAAKQQAALKESAAIVKQASSARAQAISGMSDREKRAAAAERRVGAATGSGPKCTLCSNALTKTPFERLEYKYCSIACLQAHKNELDVKSSINAVKTTLFNPK